MTVSATKATLADVAKVGWGPYKPPASGWTPVYVKVDLVNDSDRPLQPAVMGGMALLVDDAGTPLQQHTITEGFPPCQVVLPDSVPVGGKASSCVIYELPDGRSIGKVNVLSGTDVVSWTS